MVILICKDRGRSFNDLVNCGGAGINDLLRRNAVKAGIIASETGFVAVNGTRTARQVDLHAVLGILVPAPKTRVRMCATPNGNNPRADQ